MEKDATWNKNSKRYISKSHRTDVKDINDMVCYEDYICIGATNENELKKKTDIILNRLRNAGMTINEKNV